MARGTIEVGTEFEYEGQDWTVYGLTYYGGRPYYVCVSDHGKQDDIHYLDVEEASGATSVEEDIDDED